VTFEDQDVIRRSSSIDFTLPHWALEYLGAASAKKLKIAVPLTLLRKGTLVHFNLGDESSAAVPLLSGSQSGALAEMALLATAELVLRTGTVPREIASDIRQLSCERDVGCARKALDRLLSSTEPDPQSRGLLKSHPVFAPLANALVSNYIGAVLLDLRGGNRRVIHLAYDENRDNLGDGRTARLGGALGVLAGRRSHRFLVLASAAGDAGSFHFEAEAPEGLSISSREIFFGRAGKAPDEKIGSYRRSHIHYSNLSAGAQLAVELRLSPRSSTIVRAGALTSALTLLTLVAVRLQLGDIISKGIAGEAAILLVTPTLLSVYVARADEHPATTQLLWPIRIAATVPGILSFAAGIVLVTGAADFWSKFTLWTIVAVLALNTWILMRTWQRAARRQRRRIG